MYFIIFIRLSERHVTPENRGLKLWGRGRRASISYARKHLEWRHEGELANRAAGHRREHCYAFFRVLPNDFVPGDLGPNQETPSC